MLQTVENFSKETVVNEFLQSICDKLILVLRKNRVVSGDYVRVFFFNVLNTVQHLSNKVRSKYCSLPRCEHHIIVLCWVVSSIWTDFCWYYRWKVKQKSSQTLPIWRQENEWKFKDGKPKTDREWIQRVHCRLINAATRTKQPVVSVGKLQVPIWIHRLSRE